MLKKLTNLITNNLILKLAALIFAVILWLVVVNVDDPTQSKNFSATVTVENAGYMAEQGKYFEIPESELTVTFKVSAVRSIMGNLSNSDFKAVANMENIEQTEDGYRVPLEITATRYTSSVKFSNTTQYVYVDVEDLVTKQFTIKAVSSGEPAENCAVGTLEASPNVLKVSGPKSVVDRIETAQAVIDVTGASSNLTDSIAPLLYDANGKVVDPSKLTFNINTITVSAEILDVRSIPVYVSATGNAAEGYGCREIIVDPQKIRVKGAASALNAADKIEIPAELIDISGATENVERTIDITEYLPNGVELADADERNVQITVVIEPYETVEYEVPVSQITLTENPQGYETAFDGTAVTVKVSGLKSDMDALAVSDISGTLSLNGLSEGKHTLQVQWKLDTNVYTIESAGSVALELVKAEESGSSVSNGGASDGDSDGSTSGSASGSTSGSTSGADTGADLENVEEE
ncbi:MAG: YbbR-like domain-containing protein [Roseburia sp.]